MIESITGVIPGTTSEYGHKYGGSTGDSSDSARGISWHFATNIHRAQIEFRGGPEIRVGRRGDLAARRRSRCLRGNDTSACLARFLCEPPRRRHVESDQYRPQIRASPTSTFVAVPRKFLH